MPWTNCPISHIFFPPIPSTSTWINKVTLKLEVVHSCETVELTMFIMQCKSKITIAITNSILIFILFNKYFNWNFCFLTSINFSILLCYSCKHSIHSAMHTEGSSIKKVWSSECPEFSPATNTKYTYWNLKATVN